MSDFLLVDYETRSRSPLPDVGQHMYGRHHSTEILCMGWKIIGEKNRHVVTYPAIYTNDESQTKEFYYARKHARYLVAHNAPFEESVWNHTHLLTTPMGAHMERLEAEDVICTMSMGSILALPRALEAVCNALNLPIRKDIEGKKLLLQMCKPRRMIQNVSKWIEWVETDEALKRLYEYCGVDLDAEEGLFNWLRKYQPFTKEERKLWVLNQKMNQRGLHVDLDLVHATMNMIKQEEKQMCEKLRLISFGQLKSPKQVAAFKKFLEDYNVNLPNLQKKTIDDALRTIEKTPANAEAIEALQIRQALSKSSTSKYQSFIDRTDTLDGRVRDNLLFHGASTGRDSGSGVQLHNLPRGTVKVNEDTFETLKQGDLELVRMLYGKPMEVFSSALRGAIVATPGKELFCGDFSSIEARILLWVAGDIKGLKEYEDGLDSYISMASTIYMESYSKIKAEYDKEGFSEKRHVGKEVILACGFQMGIKKFAETAKSKGLDLSESLLLRAHQAFREKYPNVPQVWSNFEKAAIFAVLNPGKKITINKVTWFVDRDFLFAQLPSGRKLAFYGPEIVNEETPWGETRPKLYHWGVHPKTKHWVRASTYGGKLTENVVQAIARDCLKHSEVLITEKGYDFLINVHDEILSERTKGEGSLDEFRTLMSTVPTWAKGLPLKVGAWTGLRYKKG